jgi:hypothetical protein
LPASRVSDARALQRAARNLRCLPFRRAFYQELRDGALSSGDLAGRPDAPELLFRRLSADQLEDAFIWLIRLGVLRREVDGQGLTERVRLTPLGRQVLDRWPGEIPRAGASSRLRCWLQRHWPRLLG